MENKLYFFLRLIAKPLLKLLYRVEYVGLLNIPKEGRAILAGNHKSNYDCVYLMTSTNRMINFVAKKELIDGKFGWLFKKLGLIPVDRKKKNKQAIESAINVLNNEGLIGIFPEGTFNQSEYKSLPFKMGAVKMAMETNSKIVPFAIQGDYKLFRKNVKIIFGKPYKIKDKYDLRKENITLMNKVIKLLDNGNNE